MNPTSVATATTSSGSCTRSSSGPTLSRPSSKERLIFVLLDTRGREAFAFGHITGAWCVQLEELEGVVSRLPKDREIVTYCWGHD